MGHCAGRRTRRNTGNREPGVKYLCDTKVLLDTQTRIELEQASTRFLPRFAALMAIGVAMILLSVGAYVVLREASWLSWQALPLALMLFCIGFSVNLIIYGGMIKSSYDILLGKGDYASKIEMKRMDRLAGAVAAGLFPSMAAVFLIWGFLGDAWHISWIVFPIAAVLFGAFIGAVGAWTKTRY